jgi:hypothetical protein
MTKLVLIFALLAVSCMSDPELGEDEAALSDVTRAKCVNNCNMKYSAMCDTMNEPWEWYPCADSCRVAAPASDACESQYVAYIDCARNYVPDPPYVCHSPGPGQPTEPYPRDPDRCDQQAVAWWWCELRN